ncbi:hypothetical protein AHAS_Ahas11G0142400 [Arachis hypogaea]
MTRPSEQFRPYLRRARFEYVAYMVEFEYDWSLASALIERWRPESHSFHLPGPNWIHRALYLKWSLSTILYSTTLLMLCCLTTNMTSSLFSNYCPTSNSLLGSSSRPPWVNDQSKVITSRFNLLK